MAHFQNLAALPAQSTIQRAFTGRGLSKRGHHYAFEKAHGAWLITESHTGRIWHAFTTDRWWDFEVLSGRS